MATMVEVKEREASEVSEEVASSLGSEAEASTPGSPALCTLPLQKCFQIA